VCISCNTDDSKNLPSHSKDEVASKHLISAIEAFKLQNDPEADLIFIQLSTEEVFNKEHIPGAYSLWRPAYTRPDTVIKGLIPDRQQMNELLHRLCISDHTTIVLYDHKGNVDALRFAWILETYSIHNYLVINGGLKSWKLAGLPTTEEKSLPCKPFGKNLQKLHLDPSGHALADEVIEALDNEAYIIVDTREKYEFRAEPFVIDNRVYDYKPGAYTRGKIPGAVHLNWSELVELNGDHRIKSYRDLEFNLYKKNITIDKKVIVYCQSGSRSAHTCYVLKHILHYPYVKNYDGSWIEWSYLHTKNPAVPIEQLCGVDSFNLLKSTLEQQQLKI